MHRRLLITGAAGFIGFHLARHFAARGDHVWGLDNFNDYYDPSLKRARAAILERENVTVFSGDICDGNLLDSLIGEYAITDLVHMAAQAGVRYSTERPQAYVKANLEGFVSILEACRRHPNITLTYASSSSVYGNDSGAKASLDARADRPLTLYGATKRSNEMMAHAYHHLYGIRSTGLRYFTVYGPWGRPDMAYSIFADAMLEGRPIHLSAGGDVHRSFTYIDDIVAGTVAAVDRTGTTCDLFNLGHPESVPLSMMVALLEENLGVKAKIIPQALPPGDVTTTRADIEVSTALLGFKPTVTLPEGIARFAEWRMRTQTVS